MDYRYPTDPWVRGYCTGYLLIRRILLILRLGDIDKM